MGGDLRGRSVLLKPNLVEYDRGTEQFTSGASMVHTAQSFCEQAADSRPQAEERIALDGAESREPRAESKERPSSISPLPLQERGAVPSVS